MKGQRTSIYNSSGYTDTQDMFLAIPIVMVAAPVSAAGAAITPLAGFSNTMTLKPNFQTLIHSAELVGSGKTIHDVQSHIAMYNGFKMMSGMTTSDLAQWGSSLGLGNELESEKSAVWNATAAAAGTRQSGVGFCLNRAAVSATQGGSDTMNLVDATGQNAGAINKSLQRRMSRVIDTTLNNAGYNRIYGTSTANNLTLLTADQLSREFKPYYTTVAGRGIWYDVAICPLKYLFSAMGSIGLTKRSDFVLRLYLNTGTLQVAITDAHLATQGLGAISTNTFQNAVPFTINHIPSANNGFPTATVATSLVCGVFVAKALPTSITCNGGQIDLSTGVGSHFLQSCRVYYSQVKLAPAIETSYALENRQKQVVYENVMFNQYNAIAPAQNFAQLVSSGVKDPLYCLIIPLIGPQTLTTFGSTVATVGFEQWQSCYDTCGGGQSFSPLSLTSLNVSLGGVNVLSGANLNYTFENFLEQVSQAESFSGLELAGLSIGTINQAWWETVGRVYFVDLSRNRRADKNAMKSLSISFTNNSNAVITLLVYTVYADKLVIDVETGLITK